MTRTTRFSDVCGTMDELKRLASAEPTRLRQEPAGAVTALLEDALYMIGRMRGRVQQYRAFRERLGELLAELDAIEAIEESEAEHGADAIRQWVDSGAPATARGVAALHQAAEKVRSVASVQEQVLRQNKEVALRVHNAFEEVRGGRPWLLDATDKAPLIERLRQRYQAWLPPEPTGTIMLEWLCRDRLTVREETSGDGQPLVLFEDGGSIPMSQMRWNDELRNFLPAGSAS